MNKALSRLDDAFASVPAREAGLIACGWMLAAILVGVAAERTGISPYYVVWAIVVAVIPAGLTLALLRYAGERWALTFVTFAWAGFAAIGAAVTGGFASPLAAAFVLAPAFAIRIGGRGPAGEAAFFAALSYGVAGVTAQATTPLALGPFAACGAALSILTAGGLIAATGLTPLVRRAQIIAAPPALVDASAVERARREAAEAIAGHQRRAAELAHEFRTPLNHIIGFADAMRQRLFGPMHERYGEYVELIYTSGRNLLDLVNGLLDLSRLEAGRYALELEDFDFRFVAEETVRLMHDTASAKSITLTLEADDEAPVRADVRALRQILTNLLANAVKFTPQGGAVTARIAARADTLSIEVQDNGPGIPPAERARLGEAFERGAAGATAEGYGLGLSLVRALAHAHGGRLSFHEAPGGGALVRVSLPVARG